MKHIVAATLFCLIAVPAYSGNIKKCTGKDGTVSYTDTQCPDLQNAKTRILKQGSDNAKQTSVKQTSVSTNRLISMMPGVQYLCEKQFIQHYLRRHPHHKQAPDIRFNNIVDRYLRQESISITLSGQLNEESDAQAMTPQYNCFAKKAKMLSEWVVNIRKVPPVSSNPARANVTKSAYQ